MGLVTLFSDPMVDALTDLTNDTHKKHPYNCSINGTSKFSVGEVNYGSYIPIGSKLVMNIGEYLTVAIVCS